MTTPYEATDRSCAHCGADVEDYTGHWEASEVTYCAECYDDDDVELTSFAEVRHRVPKKSSSKQEV